MVASRSEFRSVQESVGADRQCMPIDDALRAGMPWSGSILRADMDFGIDTSELNICTATVDLQVTTTGCIIGEEHNSIEQIRIARPCTEAARRCGSCILNSDDFGQKVHDGLVSSSDVNKAMNWKIYRPVEGKRTLG